MAVPTYDEMLDTYVNDYFDSLKPVERERMRSYIDTRALYTANLFREAAQADGIDVDHTVVLCLDWTGYKYFSLCEHPFSQAGLEVVREQIQQGNYMEGVYRETLATPEDKMRIRSLHPKRVIIFDKSIQDGTSISSAIKWTLENSEDLGIEKIYLMAVMDATGMANFIINHRSSRIGMEKKHRKRRVGPVEFLKRNKGLRELYGFLDKDKIGMLAPETYGGQGDDLGSILSYDEAEEDPVKNAIKTKEMHVRNFNVHPYSAQETDVRHEKKEVEEKPVENGKTF